MLANTTSLELESGQTVIGVTHDCVVVQPAGKSLSLRTLWEHNEVMCEDMCEMDHMWKTNYVATKEFAIRALNRRWCVNTTSYREAKVRAAHEERKNRFIEETEEESHAQCVSGVGHHIDPAVVAEQTAIMETLDDDDMPVCETNRRELTLSLLDCWSDTDAESDEQQKSH